MAEEYASAAGLERAFKDIRKVEARTAINETQIAVLKSAVESIKDLPDTMRELQLTLREMQVEMRGMNANISDIRIENREQTQRINQTDNKSKIDIISLAKDYLPWLITTGYIVLTKLGII